MAENKVFPHTRLADVWRIMKEAAGGPVEMRAAVEREFGAGALRFEGACQGVGDHTVVLVDTASIAFYTINASFPTGPDDEPRATAQCSIVEPARLARGWHSGAIVPCKGMRVALALLLSRAVPLDQA